MVKCFITEVALVQHHTTKITSGTEDLSLLHENHEAIY